MLPYSIHEVYEIITEGKYANVQESYHYLRELYSNFPIPDKNRMHYVITEDSNSGFQFFDEIFNHSNILLRIQELKTEDILAIADGAAFGAMIEKYLAYCAIQDRQRISLWMPESFEYLILRSGIVSAKELDNILAFPSDYIDALEYESREKYFTHLLISLTSDKPYRYSKNSLDPYYILAQNRKKITALFPAALPCCREIADQRKI